MVPNSQYGRGYPTVYATTLGPWFLTLVKSPVRVTEREVGPSVPFLVLLTSYGEKTEKKIYLLSG